MDANNIPVPQQEGLYFLAMEAENFKGIKHRIIDIGARSLLFIGKNEAGKSSLMDALRSAMDSKWIPDAAITQGEERGKLEVVIGGLVNGKPQKYTIEVHFTPGNLRGRLIVYNELGEKMKSPATTLKSIIGNVSFDIMKWMNADKKDKLEALKALTGCAKEIDEINMTISDKKASKKAKKELAGELEGSVKHHGYSQEDVEKYSRDRYKDLEALNSELAGMSKAVESYTKMEGHKKQFAKEAEDAVNKVTESQNKITEWENELKKLQGKIETEKSVISNERIKEEKAKENLKKCDDWFATKTKPDADGISASIKEATEHNTHFEALKKYGEHHAQAIKLKDELLSIDDEVKKLEAKRGKLIEDSQLPVPGLSFTEDEIFLNGLPLEKNQINTAKLIDISTRIAISQNPKLRTIFIQDGSLLDTANRKKLVQLIESKGYRVIMEVVGDNEEVEVQFIESEVNNGTISSN